MCSATVRSPAGTYPALSAAVQVKAASVACTRVATRQLDRPRENSALVAGPAWDDEFLLRIVCPRLGRSLVVSPRVQAGVTAGSAPGHGAGQYGVVLPASGCTLVVAAAGYGKTAAVRAALAGAPVQWLADGDAAGAGTATTRDQWVVFDDLRPATLDGLLADGPGDRMFLLSRVQPPRSYVRWRGRGLLTEFGPADLVLSTARVAELMRSEYGLDDPEVAVQVHALTAGWPALVHLAGQALRASPVKPAGVLAAIASVGGTIATYVTQKLLPDVPAELRRLLRDLPPLGQVSAGLCQALGRRRAHDHVALLARIGLLSPPVPGRLSYRLVPVIAAV